VLSRKLASDVAVRARGKSLPISAFVWLRAICIRPARFLVSVPDGLDCGQRRSASRSPTLQPSVLTRYCSLVTGETILVIGASGTSGSGRCSISRDISAKAIGRVTGEPAAVGAVRRCGNHYRAVDSLLGASNHGGTMLAAPASLRHSMRSAISFRPVLRLASPGRLLIGYGSRPCHRA